MAKTCIFGSSRSCGYAPGSTSNHYLTKKRELVPEDLPHDQSRPQILHSHFHPRGGTGINLPTQNFYTENDARIRQNHDEKADIKVSGTSELVSAFHPSGGFSISPLTLLSSSPNTAARRTTAASARTNSKTTWTYSFLESAYQIRPAQAQHPPE